MEYLLLAVAAGGAFALGWTAARTVYGKPREISAEDQPIATDDEFTRSVQDWGRRYVR